MNETVSTKWTPPDRPLFDATPYGYDKDDSVTDTTENAAITYKEIILNGTTIPCTARAGHLVTTDLYSAQPAAKIFYVSFTTNSADPSTRPITFFYNGGPGSSSVYLLLGSFGPRRIKTNMPYYTPPAPYALENNRASARWALRSAVFSSFFRFFSSLRAHVLSSLARLDPSLLGFRDGRRYIWPC
jgi:carboxypeptidase C (cathepsin A)